MQPPLRQQDPRGEAVEEKQKDPHPARASSQPLTPRLSLSSLSLSPMADTFRLPMALDLRTGLIYALHLCQFFIRRNKKFIIDDVLFHLSIFF